MKTFKDLKFKKHALYPLYDKIASIDFDNGYGVSVISGQYAYTSSKYPYEVAISKDGKVCFDTPITDDVVGYLTEEGVTSIMKKVQEL